MQRGFPKLNYDELSVHSRLNAINTMCSHVHHFDHREQKTDTRGRGGDSSGRERWDEGLKGSSSVG